MRHSPRACCYAILLKTIPVQKLQKKLLRNEALSVSSGWAAIYVENVPDVSLDTKVSKAQLRANNNFLCE